MSGNRRPASFGYDAPAKIKAEASPEKQELAAFQWLSQLSGDLEVAPDDAVKADQGGLEKRLETFLGPSTTPVRPTRAIRRLLATCYVALFTRGEARRAFDTLVAVQAQLGNAHTKLPKADEPNLLPVRAVGLHLLGRLTERFGAQFLSVFAETVHLLQKYMRSSVDNNVRIEAAEALARAVRGAPRGLSDAQAKECIKALRAGLAERSMPLRTACADALAQIARYVGLPALQTVPDFDGFLMPLSKAFDGASYEARMAIARAMANVLAPTQTTFVPVGPGSASGSPMGTKLGAGMTSGGGSKKKGSGKKGANEAGDDEGGAPPAAALEERSLLSVSEMLSLLQTPLLKNQAREARVGTAEAYVQLLCMLGPAFIESHYSEIVGHFTADILAHAKFLAQPLPEIVAVVELLTSVLRTIGTRMSETGQLNALKALAEKYLGAGPDASTASLPSAKSKWATAVVLAEMGGLLSDLNGVASTLPDSFGDGLVRAVGAPSHITQSGAALCIMRYALSAPHTLAPLFNQLFSVLHKELPTITANTPVELLRKYLGYALAVSGLLAAAPKVPLHVPSGVSTQVFSLAANLLKSPGKDFKVVITIHTVAWTLLTGIMAMGSSAVKTHLSQCLLLWKDAFPKAPPTGSDIFETLVAKEGALRSLSACLAFNPDLLNPDIKKRIAVLVGNAVQMVLTLPALASTSAAPFPPATKAAPITLKYGELDALFRKRLFDCIAQLPPAQFESVHAQVLKLCGDLFAPDPADSKKLEIGPEFQVYHAFEKQPLPVNAPFGALMWQSAEYGVTTLPLDVEADLIGKNAAFRDAGFVQPVSSLLDFEKWHVFERQLHHPVQGTLHYDTMTLLTGLMQRPRPSPPGFALINSAMTAFAVVYPHVSASMQDNYLDNFLRLLKLRHDRPGKRSALLANVVTALHAATSNMVSLNGSMASSPRASTAATAGNSKAYTASPAATKSILEIAQLGLATADGGVRHASAHVLGKTAELSSAPVMPMYSKFLVNQIVDNRDPDVRAGAALAIVYLHVYTHSSVQLKTTIGVLHSLCTDTHPVVAQWATIALAILMEARPGDVHAYVPPTLSVVCRQLMNDLRPLHVARVLYGCVETLGPELQISEKLRDLVSQFTLYLVECESLEECADAWRTVAHTMLMAPGTYQAARYAPVLQALLGTDHLTLMHSSLACLCHLIQRHPEGVLASTRDLETDLVRLAGIEPALVQKSLASLVEISSAPSRWIDLCRYLLNPSQTVAAGGPSPAPDSGHGGGASGSDTEDDSEGLGVTVAAASGAGKAEGKTDQVRWTSQWVAMQSLRQVIRYLATGKERECHVDMKKAKTRAGGDWLVFRLGDLIRVAFTASTALTQQVRAEGLGLLEDVLDHFAQSEDPDYDGHMLLEQYQAQFSSALTPAFQADTYPELVSTASHVCARYIGSGITEELFTLSRIIKLLTQALDLIRNPANRSCQQANIMISLAVLSAWAELKKMSDKRSSLAEIVEPQLGTLTPMWITCLLEYSALKLDADNLGLVSTKVENLSANIAYALTARDVVLPMYHQCWISILDAVTSLLASGDPTTHLQKYGTVESKFGAIPQLTLVLLGLAFEPLVSLRSSEKNTSACVDALRAILQPKLLPSLHPRLAKELLTMMDRLLQTESQDVQLKVLQLLDTLLTNYFPVLDGDLTYHAQRLLFAAIAPSLPHLLSDPSAALIFGDNAADRLPLARGAILTLANVAAAHPAWIPMALHIAGAAFESPSFAPHMPKVIALLRTMMSQIPGTEYDELCQAFIVALVDLQVNGEDADVRKNCLLASTVCLTSLFDRPFIVRLSACVANGIARCLEVPELSVIALQCTKTLFQLAKRAESYEFAEQVISMILPDIIMFSQTENNPVLVDCVSALSAAALSTVSSPAVHASIAAMIGLLAKYPTMLQVKAAIVEGLMAIAGVHTDDFRTLISGLPEEARQVLENAFRSQQTKSPQSGGFSSSARQEKPSIELKMSF